MDDTRTLLKSLAHHAFTFPPSHPQTSFWNLGSTNSRFVPAAERRKVLPTSEVKSPGLQVPYALMGYDNINPVSPNHENLNLNSSSTLTRAPQPIWAWEDLTNKREGDQQTRAPSRSMQSEAPYATHYSISSPSAASCRRSPASGNMAAAGIVTGAGSGAPRSSSCPWATDDEDQHSQAQGPPCYVMTGRFAHRPVIHQRPYAFGSEDLEVAGRYGNILTMSRY
jgi:hypothetical protein